MSSKRSSIFHGVRWCVCRYVYLLLNTSDPASKQPGSSVHPFQWHQNEVTSCHPDTAHMKMFCITHEASGVRNKIRHGMNTGYYPAQASWNGFILSLLQSIIKFVMQKG